MLVVFTDNLKEPEQVKQLEEPKTILPNKEISEEELHRLSREAGKIEYENSLKDKENNFGDLDEIENYLLGLQSIITKGKVIESNNDQIVPDEIKEETQVDEVMTDGVNDGIKRLVYNGRNG
jgi:hypothetical protein